MKEIDELLSQGTVEALPFEEYVWRLRGDTDSKMDKIVDACSIYRDKVTQATCSKYFSPVPEITDYSISSINEMLLICQKLDIELYWDNEYTDLMYTKP